MHSENCQEIGDNVDTALEPLRAHFLKFLNFIEPYAIMNADRISSFVVQGEEHSYSILQLHNGSSELYSQLLQKLVPFLIEGGTEIDAQDSKWQIYLLVEESLLGGSAAERMLVGFCTCYAFPIFPSLEKSRLRLSQFIILPSFQRRGLGAAFYSNLLQYFRALPSVIELTGNI
jgi:histone acetyltransferase 1